MIWLLFILAGLSGLVGVAVIWSALDQWQRGPR